MFKKVVVISNTDGALYKFRKSLIKRLNNLGVVTVGVASPYSPEGSYSEKLSKICSRLYLENFVRQGLRSFCTPLKIYNICVKEEPMVVHLYGHEALIFSALAWFRLHKIQFIVTITGLGRFFSPKASFLQKLIQHAIIFTYYLAIHHISKIIFLNSHDINKFSKAFPSHKKKFILINGEGSDFSLAGAYKHKDPSDPLHFLFASRVMRDKGIVDLIQAFRRLSGDYQLSVLGTIDDSVRNDPVIIEMLNNNIENVRYFGFLPDITNFLEKSDCLILPTMYMEGLPIILVEALAKGKFIITTEAPGCADTVIEGVNGFLIKDVTPDSILSAITNVSIVNLENAHFTSIQLFQSRFSSDVVVDKIIKIYNLGDGNGNGYVV